MEKVPKRGFFPSEPKVSVLTGRRFRLEEPLFYVREDSLYAAIVPKTHIMVPKGFITDFASVPKLLWGIIGPIGKQSLPAIVHDYLYRMAIGTKKEADLIFLEALRVQGMGRFKSYMMYLGVKFGGKGNY